LRRRPDLGMQPFEPVFRIGREPQMGNWREGVGVEPTRDVYSPIPDLTTRSPKG
jgi:hypothetical protein